jgi:hypothetical protein
MLHQSHTAHILPNTVCVTKILHVTENQHHLNLNTSRVTFHLRQIIQSLVNFHTITALHQQIKSRLIEITKHK